MKHFTLRWLKRFYTLAAISLVLFAVILTSARVLFLSVDDYKQQAIEWLIDEYQADISIQDISAGIDFSGMVLTLNNVELLDSEDLPFVLKFEYLFLHLDFWDSVTEQQLNFNRISLQGAKLQLENSDEQNTPQSVSQKTELTLNKLRDIFLTQLKKVSVRDSEVNYTDNFGIKKKIIIEQLQWLNKGNDHQGVGLASFPDALGENSLKFIVDLYPKTKNKPLSGNLYLQADNLNVTDYLVEQVNSNALVVEAVVGFEAWATFSSQRIESVQVELKNNQFSWVLLDENYNLGIDFGTLQLTNSDSGWLLDGYNLAVTHDDIEWDLLSLNGKGDQNDALINLEGFSIKRLLPLFLLHSDLSEAQINHLHKLDVDAHIDQIGLSLDDKKKLQFSLKLREFKNRPVGAIPGISNANINLQGDVNKGQVDIHLAKQKIYFDGQFSRTMPVTSGDIDLRWLQTGTGLQLFSKQATLKTKELDTITDFSILFANEHATNQSTFLSLYTYASLNDASKAQYYFPVKAMGDSVFDYLEPTIKKGHVNGAQILWYGAFNHYPYAENNGIFQAWVPLKDAQYDFYGDWQGLTNLDLDLLFENDYLLMDAKKANLGKVSVGKLTAKVDHLNPNGILTIKADINEDAQKVSDYLKASPLKESVGKALSVIEVSEPLSGKITLTVPFNRKNMQTQSAGRIELKNNNLNIELADGLLLPLKKVNGSFDFINGNLSAKNIDASLFDQPIDIAFSTQEKKTDYEVDVQMQSNWDLNKLNEYNPALQPLLLEGKLDWSGQVNFVHQFKGGYQYNVSLDSATQGVSTKLPEPFYKNALHSWPLKINASGDEAQCYITASIKDKLSYEGQLNYDGKVLTFPYFSINIGQSEQRDVNKNKQVINLNLEKLNLTHWVDYWNNEGDKLLPTDDNIDDTSVTDDEPSLIALNEVNLNVKHLELFEQPLTLFSAKAKNRGSHWQTNITSSDLQTDIEYRPGVPTRIDINAQKINLQELDLSQFKARQTVKNEGLKEQSTNLRDDFPEVLIECETCIYKDIDLSPLSLHVYPTKKRLNIDYLKIGGENEFTNASGFWNQRLTNIIFDIEGDRNGDLIRRLGFANPVFYQKGQLSGAVNWVGAPWQANSESLNGAFSAQLSDGAITEVSDKGARLLSVFSLDGIRRSLNVEFDNVFAKGFNFDELKFNGNINDGVLSNDDFYLDGSAGKITGNGLIDLSHQTTNFKFSYSPAVTSSLPVLAAFAINPLTGAAVLVLTKLLEPVVDTIIRVDFSVTGDLQNPNVKLESRQRGQIKLENSEVLQEMSEQQQLLEDGNNDS